MIQRALVFVLLLVAASAFAQEMQEGFTYLETGKYKEATIFFKEILVQYPDNKTARLCYGRGVGLSGNSEKAVLIFTDLLKEYPNDFEIKLNYAESLLWNKEFTIAEPYYENLILENEVSFPAVLGYANTLSNLKNYEKALHYVNKALVLEKGNNNALVSRKYIRLGYANMLAQDKEYDKALQLLDQNLVDFPNDKDTQLNKANIYLITNELINAEETYLAIATNSKDSIISLNGLALVAHKNNKEKQAIEISGLAKTKVNKYKEDKDLYTATIERYIQALLWNQKFTDAKREIDTLRSFSPNSTKVLGLEAAYGMYTSRFKPSLTSYKNILAKEATSFDGNLGIANTYRAIGKEMQSYEYAFKTLQHYPKQPDAEKLIKTLKKSHTPFVEQKTAFTIDNGNNEALSFSLRSEIPLSTKFKTTLAYVNRTTKHTTTDNSASSNDVTLGFLYAFTGKIALQSRVGISQADAITVDYTKWIGEMKIKTKPFRLQNLEVGYKRELQNFNADLIDKEIIMEHYFANYNLGTNFNLGWYSQYMYTTQTDGNVRNLLFTSLYYNVLRSPMLKMGVNYQQITFQNQVPMTYFSPKRYNTVEIFVDVLNKQEKKWFYSANVAAGIQFIEEDPGSTTFRGEGKLGHHFSERFMANVYGRYSNIASATAAGFQFTEFGFQLKWYFLKAPIFDEKINKLK